MKITYCLPFFQHVHCWWCNHVIWSNVCLIYILTFSFYCIFFICVLLRCACVQLLWLWECVFTVFKNTETWELLKFFHYVSLPWYSPISPHVSLQILLSSWQMISAGMMCLGIIRFKIHNCQTRIIIIPRCSHRQFKWKISISSHALESF